MSFGASPSDIIIVVTFCQGLYRKCRDAGGEYDEISREVQGLHTVLKHLRYEVEAPESPLNRDRSLWGRQLAPIICDCDYTLRQLDGLIVKYGRLAAGSGSPTSPRILWDKVRFGSNEMDQLGTVRVKLISHKTSLTLFLDTIQLHQSGKMATALDNHGGQLDIILDKVDGIAARMTQGNGSIMTSYDDDDKEVWKQFRRELVAEGFSSDVLQQHKDVLRAYIREIDQKGLLDEVPIDASSAARPVGGVNPQHWLDSVRSAPSEDGAPSYRTFETSSEDASIKEMIGREENLKFPMSMKLERPKPESRPQQQLVVPVQKYAERRKSEGSTQNPSPIPRLITSDEKDVVFLNTDGSESESESEGSSKRSKSPSNGMIIRTSDLFASSQALTLQPQPRSPSRVRGPGSFGEDEIRRSMAQRPKKLLEYGSSPVSPEGNPNLSQESKVSNERHGNAPKAEQKPLAPDEHGNPIPADAKWTRINRRLVSPEVLAQDRRRYEARPEFVAVLGILTRAEIESLASRSAALRQARHLRNHAPPPPPPSQSQQAPPQPPRPIYIPVSQIPLSSPIPMPIPYIPRRRSNHGQRSGRDTPSTDSDYDSSSSSSTHHRRRSVNKNGGRPYPPSDIGDSVSGYPNQYGAPLPPPSPIRSPVSMKVPPTLGQGQSHSAPGSYQGSGGVRFSTSPSQAANPARKDRDYYDHHDRQRGSDRDWDYERSDRGNRERERERERDRDRERERDREYDRNQDRDHDRDREHDRSPHTHHRRKHTSHAHNSSSRHNTTPRGSSSRGNLPGKGSSRWKEHMTAAGIGGAAASLMNVLSEAAEGL